MIGPLQKNSIEETEKAYCAAPLPFFKECKTIKYRDHKGSLSDSMETVQEVSSLTQIIAYINKVWAICRYEVEELKFSHQGIDNRIGWDTYYVLVKFKGQADFTVVGMSDGFLEQ